MLVRNRWWCWWYCDSANRDSIYLTRSFSLSGFFFVRRTGKIAWTNKIAAAAAVAAMRWKEFSLLFSKRENGNCWYCVYVCTYILLALTTAHVSVTTKRLQAILVFSSTYYFIYIILFTVSKLFHPLFLLYKCKKYIYLYFINLFCFAVLELFMQHLSSCYFARKPQNVIYYRWLC